MRAERSENLLQASFSKGNSFLHVLKNCNNLTLPIGSDSSIKIQLFSISAASVVEATLAC